MSSTNIMQLREQVNGLKRDLEQTKPVIVDMNRGLTTYLALSRRLGLPPHITNLIMKFQQGRIAVETLARCIQLFYVTSGPLGWIIAAGGMALGGLMLLDTFEMGVPEY